MSTRYCIPNSYESNHTHAQRYTWLCALARKLNYLCATATMKARPDCTILQTVFQLKLPSAIYTSRDLDGDERLPYLSKGKGREVKAPPDNGPELQGFQPRRPGLRGPVV
ncbi:uncharacterized protein LOC122719472 [Apis laboriosa]|uniref:uncharacterized protein LOC122719472 n=1 Tax=Apis laboriosa TaxID=183418 RepID=UPI001CC4EFED|nr:uncharacterized protein LOC122719472 [Apis laboriosa]